jgi:hypothetical protein
VIEEEWPTNSPNQHTTQVLPKKAFHRRTVHGYAKKTGGQPKTHATYNMVNRIPSQKSPKPFNATAYPNLFAEGCCKPIETCCVRRIDPNSLLAMNTEWRSLNRSAKQERLKNLLLHAERNASGPGISKLNHKFYELKVCHFVV